MSVGVHGSTPLTGKLFLHGAALWAAERGQQGLLQLLCQSQDSLVAVPAHPLRCSALHTHIYSTDKSIQSSFDFTTETELPTTVPKQSCSASEVLSSILGEILFSCFPQQSHALKQLVLLLKEPFRVSD